MINQNVEQALKLFERGTRIAQRHGGRCAEQELKAADGLRRLIARCGSDPGFLPEWGAPRSRHWLLRGPDGQERISPVMPQHGHHLTVWQFDGFEITATFDKWAFLPISYTPHPRDELEWRKTPPPIGEWEAVANTPLHSTLWRRPCPQEKRHD